MFDNNINRVGFACKIQSAADVGIPELAIKATTITWLNNQTRDKAVEKLWTLLKANCQALYKQVEWVSRQPHNLRMFRISSDVLTAYTHDDWMWWYFEPDVVAYLETHLAKVGALARQHDVRLSFHPGQFCVLASENPDVVERSILEFEYHADLVRYMGFGLEFQDFKCNVHVGGKLGPNGIKAAMRRLSPVARNILTIENAEFTWGIEASLELVDTCALVLDIHHHWIASGEYIMPEDSRVQQLWESWRGVRPVVHYSVSREDVLPDHDSCMLPSAVVLKLQGHTKAKLRAHSDYYWNHMCNDWAADFLPYADIMCESKQKNISAHQFAKGI